MDSATALQTVLTAIPARARKAIYKTAKILAALVTLALLILPSFTATTGIDLPNSDRWVAIATGLLALLAHLADSNTITDPLVDVNPAPETGNPVPPEGVTDPGFASVQENPPAQGEPIQPDPPAAKDPQATPTAAA